VNFARQGDSPFLLAAPGTEIARRLGDLTNVSLVFGAASEAGRRRKRLERDLEAARKRREALLAEAQQFAGLKRRLAAVREAEAQLGLLEAQAAQAEALRAAAGRLERAEAAVAACRAEAARQAPPSTGQLDELVKRLTRLRELSAELAGAESQAARLRDEAARALAAERDAHAAVHGALVAAGACPTCGQAVA
jgi:DNA repair exonuclease SbcCD ATPase subunit